MGKFLPMADKLENELRNNNLKNCPPTFEKPPRRPAGNQTGMSNSIEVNINK